MNLDMKQLTLGPTLCTQCQNAVFERSKTPMHHASATRERIG